MTIKELKVIAEEAAMKEEHKVNLALSNEDFRILCHEMYNNSIRIQYSTYILSETPDKSGILKGIEYAHMGIIIYISTYQTL